MMHNKFIFFISFIFIAFKGNAQSFFNKIDESRIAQRSNDKRTIIPDKYDVYRLDVQGIKKYLTGAPLEFQSEQGIVLEVPLADGRLLSFKVVESPVMEAGIATRYPSIRSYKAYTEEGLYVMHFVLSPKGFYASILTPDGEVYIDPYSENNTEDYIVYYIRDHNPDLYKDIPVCGVEHAYLPANEVRISVQSRTDNVSLRVFRMAMACTGEWGSVARRGTIESCLADMNTMVSRLNAIYESELATRFVIMNDNDKLIFLDPVNDPYENSNKGLKLVENNTTILNDLLKDSGGAGAYDIGHVLSVCNDVGGVAYLGSLCQFNKGNGVTCNNNNDLSNIVTRVMAHEIGHQFDAPHTFNICTMSSDQRFQNGAYEPGSGSTIMSYAGLCGKDDVVVNNDAYFHVGSLISMYNLTNAGGKSFTCSEKIKSNNHYPVVKVPKGNFVIPVSTPFELKGSGTDEDGDILTYCWEQFDLGPQSALGSQVSDGPLFRSYKPSETGDVRFFPRPGSLLSGTTSDKTEVMPAHSRTMAFKLTVRDNNPDAAGVVWDEFKFDVTDKSGPFRINKPESGTKFKAGQLTTVIWDVSNTDMAPVNCKYVHIYGSFASALRDDDPNLIPLALNVPNNGRADVVIPDQDSYDFRIVIKAADNIFLAVSAPLLIEDVKEPAFFITSASDNLHICKPEDTEVRFRTQGLGGFEGEIQFEVVEQPQGIQVSFDSAEIEAGKDNVLQIVTSKVERTISGQIIVKAYADGLDTVFFSISILVEGNNIDEIQTRSPENGYSGLGGRITFEWEPNRDAIAYEIQVSVSPDFSAQHIIASGIVSDTFFTNESLLDKSTIYYWRIRTNNLCGKGIWSATQAFMTEAMVCNKYTSGTQRIEIPTTSNASVELPMEIKDNGIVSDVNITRIQAQHDRVGDLEAYLIAPSGKEALLWSRQCGKQQNLNIGLDDQASSPFQCPVNTGQIYATHFDKGADKLEVFNGEQMFGTWILKLIDKQSGQGGVLQELNLELCRDNNVLHPYIVNNYRMGIHPGDKKLIFNDLLKSMDDDNIASELLYTLVNIPAKGLITLQGKILGTGATFTQEDIEKARVLYWSDPDYQGELHFLFTVSDGNGGWIGITRFNIWADESVGTAVDDYMLSKDIFIYPNPTHDKLHVYISGKASGFQGFKLTDISGRIVEEGSLSGQTTMLDIQNIEKGVYLLNLTDGRQTIIKKVVKL